MCLVVFAVDAVCDRLLRALAANGAYLLQEYQMKRLLAAGVGSLLYLLGAVQALGSGDASLLFTYKNMLESYETTQP